MEDGEEPVSRLKYKHKRGTEDSGREYEIKLLTLLALRCASQDVDAAWMATNVDNVGSFDDIILYLEEKTVNSGLFYMIQMKHHDKPKTITEDQFITITKKGNFSLAKYAESFDHLIEGIQARTSLVQNLNLDNSLFVIFTNMGTNQYDFLKPVTDGRLLLLNTDTSAKNMFEFDFSRMSSSSSFRNLDYCQNIRLLSNQKHANKFDTIVTEETEKIMHRFGVSKRNAESVTKNFSRYIKRWAKGDTGDFYCLAKQDILEKLAEILLRHVEIDLRSEQIDYCDFSQKRVWNAIVCSKEVSVIKPDPAVLTFLKQYIGSEIKQYFEATGKKWKYKLSAEEKTVFIETHCRLKEKMLEIVGRHGAISIFDIYRCLWLRGELPLLLPIDSLQDYEDVIAAREISDCKLKVIIVITEQVAERLPPPKCHKTYFITLNDLDIENRNEILSHPVHLQGKSRSVKLGSIIRDSMYKYIRSEDVINILIKKFQIGEAYQPLPLHFINRKLSRPFLADEVLEKVTSDFFLIQTSSSVTFVQRFPVVRERSNIVFSTENISQEFIDTLNKQSHAIHRLKFHEVFGLEWIESFGSVKNLLPFHYDSLHQPVSVDVSTLWIDVKEVCGSCNIVQASPGMGKSTLLDFISHYAPPNVWVLKISLNAQGDYFESISEENAGENAGENAQDHLRYFGETIIERDKCTSSKLAVSVFHKLLNEKKVLVLLDGFDEIPTCFRDKVIKIAKGVLMEGYCLWLTTRPITQCLLEEELNTISTTLKPLAYTDQKDFLTNYFIQSFISNTENQRPFIEEFSIKLLETARFNLNDVNREFTGIPLHIELLAEVFGEECRKSLNANKINFNKSFDLLYLYEEFIRKKNKIFFDTYGTGLRDKQDIFQELHQVCALRVLFSREELKELEKGTYLKERCNRIEYELQSLQREGVIVVEQMNSVSAPELQIRFVHRTFAEYFAAQWLSININSEVAAVKKTVRVLMEKRFLRYYVSSEFPKEGEYHKFLFRIFDLIVAKNKFLHLAIINGQVDEAKRIMKKQPTAANEIDECGRTVMHIVALHGKHYPSRFTSNCDLKDETADIIEDVDKSGCLVKDVLGYDALYYALATNSLFVANKICEISNISSLGNDVNRSWKSMYFKYCLWLGYKSLFNVLLPHFLYSDVLLRDVYGSTSLHTYFNPSDGIETENLRSWLEQHGVETLLELFRKFFFQETKTSLFVAAAFGTESEVHSLLSKDVVNDRDDNENTALHYAAIHGHIKTSRILLEWGAKVNVSGNENNTPLHYAAKFGNSGLAPLLLSKGAHINTLNNSGLTPAVLAINGNHYKVLKLLESSQQDKIGNSLLHYAAKLGHVECVDELLHRSQTNMFNKFLQTPMHLAVAHRHTEVVKLLLSTGVSYDDVDVYGKSPLHYAAENGDSNTAALLLCKGANANKFDAEIALRCEVRTQDITTRTVNATPMHLAAAGGHVDMVKLLISNGGRCNQENTGNEIPLHGAAREGHANIVELLISENSEINHQNVFGQTPLVTAIAENQVEAVSVLLLADADCNIEDKKGFTSLHHAVTYSRSNVVSEILSRRVDVNKTSRSNMTPLHWAALFANAIRIRVFNKDGFRTNLIGQLFFSAKLILKTGYKLCGYF